ncbi:hypothetical protein B7G68_07200 [Caulobacter segnis]|uniref:Tat pathway signal protein n=2 Tax=Caulobacter segnis TaxID=88688 RepID=D5VIS7_CAUST|nr:hypothetical protein [Caulobacter segnis]ADG09893.1 conserved hypothetical protein [Caulobacter segnis ATCC 21756]AVQ01651.1 hypothetical protein B7G68_07200 [Caulobacter segnis]
MLTRRALITATPLLVAGCSAGESPYDRAARDLWRLPDLGGGVPMLALVHAATLAANGHNTQPWRFRIQPRVIEILPDFSRRTPVVDPDDHHLFVSLGCALETLLRAGLGYGWAGEPELLPSGGVRIAFSSAPARPDALFQAIPHRASTRTEYDGRPVSAATLRGLEAAVGPEVALRWVLDPDDRAHLTDMIVDGNSAQLADPAFMRELTDWIRFDSREALAQRDGLFTAASGNLTAPRWLGERLLPMVMTEQGEAERIARWMKSSAGAAIFTGPSETPAGWIAVGRAFTRFALKATAAGLKLAFLNQPVEDIWMRRRMAAWMGAPARRPDLVVRFGYGPELPRSLRRPTQAVLVP